MSNKDLWNLKVVYKNQTEPTKKFEGSFENVLEESKRYIKEEGFVGIYISKLD